jgi:hypothetical protein
MQGPGVTCESDAMTDAWGNLHIDVVDDEIIVTLPLTSYTVTYYKPTNSPQLLAKRIANKDDPRVPVTLSEFLVRAWKAANDRGARVGVDYMRKGHRPKPTPLRLRQLWIRTIPHRHPN